eukprot:gnl/MRDRNA2_/MRDRNA2_85851_c0_seq1.p1 gnl/MRDRNA2_/MRDRNA2_85851_c0~~gnl/MRDRNA2_/MRDRNA2_85851_c0_seq1.p1  ORF type:complete len:204 (+),score=12.25 gnl/MRDRNA2_/MRDRNA2_85851_c0_seq1:117-728(+)
MMLRGVCHAFARFLRQVWTFVGTFWHVCTLFAFFSQMFAMFLRGCYEFFGHVWTFFGHVFFFGVFARFLQSFREVFATSTNRRRKQAKRSGTQKPTKTATDAANTPNAKERKTTEKRNRRSKHAERNGTQNDRKHNERKQTNTTKQKSHAKKRTTETNHQPTKKRYTTNKTTSERPTDQPEKSMKWPAAPKGDEPARNITGDF